MSVTVEFYGLVRHWTGCPSVSVEAAVLGDALRTVSARFPQLTPACIVDARLQPGFLVNINCQRFTTDSATPLRPGDAVLILSSDVGG